MAIKRWKKSAPVFRRRNARSNSPKSNVQCPTSSNAAEQKISPYITYAEEANTVKINKFEDIESWKKARRLTNEIYQTSASGGFVRDFGLKDQIRRASVSILSNIAEGFERGGDKEFSQFLAVAKGSCGEVRAQLYVALDQGYLSPELFDQLLNSATEVGQLLSGFIRYLKRSPLHGSKYN
jgi:four helix bundle protein